MKFEYLAPKNKPLSSDELLADIKRVALELNTSILTQKLYLEHWKYDARNIARRFWTWNNALIKVDLKWGNIISYTDEQLFENILNIWQFKGKQIVRRDLDMEPSKISSWPYNRRFNSWSDAILSFIEWANQNDSRYDWTGNIDNVTRKQTNRDPSLRLRFRVLQRDNFSCVQCWASPAKARNIELHIDHIKPWSKGGETVLENLQTLCFSCNLWKSNIE